ncbi:MAG TPA: PQQ-binding-like beta-propeller repeat protein [Actinomycetota bacterium]|nr:PQQ-binding-like beta-propeller repeat protein [Actinomycetota bacterium]
MESPPVTGFVHDLKGRPVPGVAVSDSLNVVSTGADGRFVLPGSGTLVWVCAPPGWTCGQWWLRRHAGDHVFVLSPGAKTGPARIAQATDLHLSLAPALGSTASPATGTALHPLGAAVRNSGAGLLVVTGDVTDRGTVPELKAAVKQLDRIGVPYRLLPGNHDHYGHNYEPRSTDEPLLDDELGSGTFTRWEEVIGPRWWSMNYGGLHLVALDWFSARTGADHRTQMSWLGADLEMLPPGSPVVLLSHDQPGETFLQALRRRSPLVRLVAVLSGHWHAARGVKLKGTLHLSTGPGLVAGRSCSPPQLRIVDWDGADLTSRTVLPAGFRPQRFRALPPRWAFQARIARSHSVHLASSPEGVVATTADHDSAAGTVALLDGQTGKPRWSWTAPHPVPSAAAVDQDGTVYVQTSGGMVVRLEGGRPTWMVESADSVTTKVTSAPLLTGDGGLITQGSGFVQCLKCLDGRMRWVRYVGDTQVHYAGSDAVMAGGLALVHLGGSSHGLAAFRPEDGSVAWADGDNVDHPRSTPSPVGDGTAVVVREGALVERFEVATGRVRWRTALRSPASGATPVVIDELVLVVTCDAVIHVLDSRTGWLLRSHRLGTGTEGSAGWSGRPHIHAAVLAAGNLLHVVTVTGEWWRLDPYHWEPQLVASMPVAVAAPPVQCGPNLVLPGREGIVLAASLYSLASGPTVEPGLNQSNRTNIADRWLRSLKSPKP